MLIDNQKKLDKIIELAGRILKGFSYNYRTENQGMYIIFTLKAHNNKKFDVEPCKIHVNTDLIKVEKVLTKYRGKSIDRANFKAKGLRIKENPAIY